MLIVEFILARVILYYTFLLQEFVEKLIVSSGKARDLDQAQDLERAHVH